MRLAVEGGSATPSTVIRKAPVLPKAPVKYTPPKPTYSTKPIQQAAAKAKATPKINIKKPPVLPKSPTAVAKGDPYTKTKQIQAAAAKSAPKIISPPKQTTTNNPNGWKKAPYDIGPTSKTATKTTTKTTTNKGNGGSGYSGSGGSSGGSHSGSSSGGGGSSSGGKTTGGKPSTFDPTKDPNYLASMAKLNALWGQANGYKGQIDAMMKAGFSYDPTKDASYQSLQTLAQKNAKIASGDAMETMNDRGILNSTVTGDRLGQIEQTAQDAVTAQVPALQQAAYGQYMDKLTGLTGLWNSTVSQAQQERAYGTQEKQWQQEFNNNNSHWQQEFDTNNAHWNKSFDYTAAQDAVNNSQEASRISLAEKNYNLSELGQIQSSAGYKSDVETNKALGEIVQFKKAEDAWNYISEHSQAFINSGVSIDSLINNVKKRFPGSEKSSAANKTTVFSK